MIERTLAQLSFEIDNVTNTPAQQNTIYISTDPTQNKLTFNITLINADSVTFSSGTGSVPPSQSPESDSGSLIYLDLSPLKLDSIDINSFSATGWGFTLYDQVVCMYVTQNTPITLNEGSSIVININGMAVPSSISSGTGVSLSVNTYNVPGIATTIVNTTIFKVVLLNPPGEQADLHQDIAISLAPSYGNIINSIAEKDPATDSIAKNSIAFIFSVQGNPVKAGTSTAFIVSFVYATDTYGYGALTTPTIASDRKDYFNFNVDNDQWQVIAGLDQTNPSWLLKPPSGQDIIEAASAIQVNIENVVTYFQPGPTIMTITYTDIDGYADGFYSIPLEKVAQVDIISLSADPNPVVLFNSQEPQSVTVSWKTDNDKSLLLEWGSASTKQNIIPVTGSSFPISISESTTATLKASAPSNPNFSNIAYDNVTIEVKEGPYLGIFMRNQLGESATDPVPSTYQSPDIIIANTIPLSDPTIYATTDSYNTQPPQALSSNTFNYIYLRMVNTNTIPVTARLWFYYTASPDIYDYENWTDQNIYVGGQEQNYIDMDNIPAGAVTITPTPFLINNSNMSSGSYTLLVYIENNPTPTPTPPNFAYYNSFKDFMCQSPAVVWISKVSITSSSNPPEWQQTIPIRASWPSIEFPAIMSIKVGCNNGSTKSLHFGSLAFNILIPGSEQVFLNPPFQVYDYSITISPLEWVSKDTVGMLTIMYWKDDPNYCLSQTQVYYDIFKDETG